MGWCLAVEAQTANARWLGCWLSHPPLMARSPLMMGVDLHGLCDKAWVLAAHTPQHTAHGVCAHAQGVGPRTCAMGGVADPAPTIDHCRL